MKRELSVLKLLVRDWARWSANPKIARRLLLQKKYFGDQVRELVSALLLCDGDLHRTCQWISQKRGYNASVKFAKWCDSVKGGAS